VYNGVNPPDVQGRGGAKRARQRTRMKCDKCGWTSNYYEQEESYFCKDCDDKNVVSILANC
jgi:hypothetical protein